MDQKLIEENKKKLLEEKTHLEKLLSAVGHKDQRKDAEEYQADFPNMGDSEDDNASEVEAYAANIGEEKVLDAKLQKVNAALVRIEAGTYGTCSVGGEEIEAARLRALPEAD